MTALGPKPTRATPTPSLFTVINPGLLVSQRGQRAARRRDGGAARREKNTPVATESAAAFVGSFALNAALNKVAGESESTGTKVSAEYAG